MAEKFYVYYRKLGYASAPYPVIHVVPEDDADYVPMDYLTINGWSQTNYDWAVFDTWTDVDGETSHNEWFVTPGTPPTASTTNKDNLDLEQRRAIKQGEVDAAIAAAKLLLVPDSKVNASSRLALAAHVEALQALNVAGSANPESISVPALPAYSLDATDLADRAAEFMGDNTVTYNKVMQGDRENLLPEFSFDDGRSDFFSVSNGTLTFSTDSLSGGYGAVLTKTTASGADAAHVRGLTQNYTSVRTGIEYTWEVDWRHHAGTFTASTFVVYLRFYNENKVELTQANNVLYQSGGIDLSPRTVLTATPSGTSWTLSSGRELMPQYCRYVTLEARILTNNSSGVAVRLDSMSLRRTIMRQMIGEKEVNLSKLYVDNALNGEVIVYDSSDSTFRSLHVVQESFEFTLANLGANTTGAMERVFSNGAAAVNIVARDRLMPKGGRVIGMILESSAATTGAGSSIIARLRINGVVTTFNGGAVALSPTASTGSASLIQYSNGVGFSANDTVGVSLISTGITSTTNDYICTVIVQYDAFG